jgi:hypothetical protein
MSRFSEILLSNLEEMEFLTRTLSTTRLYYFNINEALAQTVAEAEFAMLNATLDLAIDLQYKLNHHIDKQDFIRQIVKNLQLAMSVIEHFPSQHKITSFNEIELEISIILDFAKDYSNNGYRMVGELSLEEKKLLNNKILIVKSRRAI